MNHLKIGDKMKSWATGAIYTITRKTVKHVWLDDGRRLDHYDMAAYEFIPVAELNRKKTKEALGL